MNKSKLVMSLEPIKEIVIDLTQLKLVVNNDESRLNNMIQLFIDSLPEMADDISVSLSKRDYTELRKAIHKIKPAIAMVCPGQCMEMLQSLADSEELGEGEVKLLIANFDRSIHLLLAKLKSVIA